jgi:hypothetical protein
MASPLYPGTSQPVMAVGGLLLDSSGNTISDGTYLYYPGVTGQRLASSSALNDPLGHLIADGTYLYYPGGTGNKLASATALYSVDGTAGATAGPFASVSSIRVKNGLVTTLQGV